MNASSWERVREIFERALQLPADERAEWVRHAAAGDDALRAEVEALLAAHGATGDFMEEPPRRLAAEILDEAADDSLPGERLGPYAVGPRIGRGGVGSVYAGERQDGTFTRQVAIKVLRRGLATPEMLRRFDAERRILASIDHPNIARLLDAGSTPDDRPYLVMERVDGDPIDVWCEARSLSSTARLRLFLQVCAAVEVAHRSLVVHRDLKPGNIMVTADGTVKLLDFGIAKLLDPEAGGDETVAEQRILTPDFASPEQFRGGAVTTASDVYSLGVVLYLLLSGQRPHRLSGLAPLQQDETLATSPSPPSAVAPASAQRALRGDLDTIVLMALRQEPERRYPSVRELGEDIERYLEGRPVAARPDTLPYRARKFIGRHRAAVAAAVTAVLLAGAAMVAIGIQSRRIAAESARVGAVNDFLQQILRSADPARGLGGDVTVVEALRAAIPRIDGAFESQPDIEADVRQNIAATLLQLGAAGEAAGQFELALRLRRQVHGDRSLPVADSLNGLGEATFDLGDLDGAEQRFAEALDIRRQLLGADDVTVAVVLDNLGNVAHEHGDLEQAEALYAQAQAIWTRAAPDSAWVATSLNNLAAVAHDRDDLDTAEALYSESLAMSRRALGDDHPDVAVSLGNLAALRHDRGDLAGAEPLYREAAEIMRRVGGSGHPQLAASLDALAVLLQDMGRVAEARDALEEAAAILRAQPRVDAEDLAWVLEGLGDLAAQLDDVEGARSHYTEALTLFQQPPGDEDSVQRVRRLLADLDGPMPAAAPR